MATRDDLYTEYQPSPRIVEVQSPSTEISIQDLLDTLRVSEENFSEGLSFEKLIDAAGKEDLGGGVLVGITANLQNAQLSFEARRTPAEIGSVTTASGAGSNGLQTFADSSADFVGNDVERGSMVVNFTDRSIADVYEVIDANTLITRTLVNGSDNEYEIGDQYHVFNVTQCNINGGNLVAVDDADAQISPVFPTAFTQIVRTASSSATLQESVEIQQSSFENRVSIDVINGTSGTSYPIGTPNQPVNNLSEAKTIADGRGLKRFGIVGSITIDDTVSIDDFIIEGENPGKTTITFDSCSSNGLEVINSTVTGTLISTDPQYFSMCVLENISFCCGEIFKCGMRNTTTLTGVSPETVRFVECYGAGDPSVNRPVLDLGGASGPLVTMVKYAGDLFLKNKSGGDLFGIVLHGGRVELENTITGGTFLITGFGVLTDNSVGASVSNGLLTSDAGIINTLNETVYDGVSFDEVITKLLSMATGRIVESSSGVYEFYEQDNTTVSFILTKAGNERTRS